jgi:hypothetical protein
MSHSLHIIKNESTARDNLRAAIEVVETAELGQAKSIEAHTRAQTMHDAAKADLASFDHLDAEIAHHHAGKLRVAIATGGAAPDLSQLPEHMAGAKAKRAAAIDKLGAISAVHGELAEDLQTSAKAVELEKYQLDLATESVVAEDAEAMAVKWLADPADLRKRFWMFDALSGRKIRLDPNEPKQHFGTGYRPMKLGTAIHEIVIRSRGVIGNGDVTTEQREKALLVGEYIVALHRDPDAKL